MVTGRDRSGADERPEELGALRAENDALRARIASLVAVIEVMDDAVFVKGGDGRYRMINSAAPACSAGRGTKSSGRMTRSCSRPRRPSGS